MKQEYDFSRGRRGAVVPQRGKTRITMYVDNDVLDAFRSFSEEAGTGYQTMINEALKDYLGKRKPPIDEETLRRVLREECTQRVDYYIDRFALLSPKFSET